MVAPFARTPMIRGAIEKRCEKVRKHDFTKSSLNVSLPIESVSQYPTAAVHSYGDRQWVWAVLSLTSSSSELHWAESLYSYFRSI